MKNLKTVGLVAAFACTLAACGGEGSAGSDVNDSGVPGTLVQSPPLRTASLTAAELDAQLQASAAGQQLRLVAGAPTCGVDVHYIQYYTLGGKAERTSATGALMIPTGSAPPCTGARPTVLYAHGTAFEKRFNLAAVADSTNPANSEAVLIAAMFAAQGYIVVAPNYAGYDASPLPYHPYLNADQQAGEMLHAFTAASAAIGHVFAAGTTRNGKTFVAGYSQGGHAAMAAVRLMQATGLVTASAPMSGPYALLTFGDAILFGSVNIGSTLFLPLLTTSYQQSYGGIYAAPGDLYAQPYADGIETLLPANVPPATLFTQGKLPQTALFSSTTPVVPTAPALTAALAVPADPLFATGFGANALVQNSVRVAYALDASTPATATAPAYPLRAAFARNDLRSGAWVPANPMLLCGGNADPTVFFSVNTRTMETHWSALAPPGRVTVLDVDSSPSGVNDPFAAAKIGFGAARDATLAAGGQVAVVQNYHGGLVPPFCMAAARGFFSQF